jgi:hypothetical protein
MCSYNARKILRGFYECLLLEPPQKKEKKKGGGFATCYNKGEKKKSHLKKPPNVVNQCWVGTQIAM